MTMKHTVKPLYLVPDAAVTIVEKNDDPSHAYVYETKGGFEITVNPKSCMTLFKKSWLSKKIEFDEFMCGILLHEVSHIKYGTFTLRPVIKNELFHYINNCLLDNQIEAALTHEHPSLAKYIQWILIGIRREADLSKVKKHPEYPKVQMMLSSLFYMTRFGVILPETSDEFRDFCLPQILSATRGGVKNVMNASLAIYEFIFSSVDDDELKEKMRAINFVVRSLEEGDFDVLQDGIQVAQSNALDVISGGLTDKGKLPGSGTQQLQLREEETGFYRKTVAKHWKAIQTIRATFKRRLDELNRVMMYEGDLSLHRQQQAYISSLTGEEERNYQVLMRNDPSVDVAIIRDISGSTDTVKVPYAEATVCLLAATEKLYGIRQAEIDFSDTAITLLAFDESLREARIQPDSQGGTNLLPALVEAEKMRWRGRKRICFIITDNGLSDFRETAKKMEEMNMRLKIKFQKIDIGGGAVGADVVSCSIDDLPHTISQTLLKLL